MPATQTDTRGGRWADVVTAVVAPVVAGRHDEIDRLGRLPDDVVAAMHRSGLFRTWIPDEFGGRDSTVAEGLELIEELARLDSAVGWVTMINITTTCLAGSIGHDAARDVFSDPAVVAGGTTAPTGRAVDTDGGLRLTGEWAWGSGIHNATWMACGALRDGERPRPVLALVPVGELEILDTWHVSGMQGTGSTHYRATDVFVPEGRVLDLVRAAPWSTRPFHRFAIFGLLALAVSSVAVGLGRRALDEFRDLATSRTLFGTREPIAASAVAQAAYARAEADVLAAAALRRATVADAWLEAQDGPLSTETRRLLRLSSTNATFASARAIDLLWEHAGAGSVYRDGVLQRLQRDVHVVTQHFRVAARTWEMCGAVALGRPFDGQL
jgi:alkylation response protein AidB-like acyl-CoA dehydrogenase